MFTGCASFIRAIETKTVNTGNTFKKFDISEKNYSGKFDAPGSQDYHFQQQPAMFPTVYIAGPVTPSAVTNGKVHDFEICPGGVKKEIKIAKRIQTT